MHCVDDFRSQIPHSDDPLYILTSLIGLLNITLLYYIWDKDVRAFVEMVHECCDRAEKLITASIMEELRPELFQRVGGGKPYRE